MNPTKEVVLAFIHKTKIFCPLSMLMNERMQVLNIERCCSDWFLVCRLLNLVI